jgi:uncharacterized protein (TIRG00374 family)
VRSAGRATLGLAISALLIWWTLKDVALAEVWAVIRAGNLWLLGAAVAVATGSFLIRALRWNVLLQPVKPDTTLDSRFGAVTIGFMANNLIPARVGEFVRAYAFSRMEAISLSGAFGSVVVERFLDGVVLLVFLLLPVVLPGFPASEAEGTLGVIIRVALLGLVGVGVLMVALLLWPGVLLRATDRLLAKLPAATSSRVLAALEAFLGSIQVLRRPGLMVPAVAWSFAHWGWHALSFYLAMAAFGVHVGWAAAFFTEAVVGFVVALPSAPGFFGTFHYAANWALSNVYGVEPARSLAFAYGFHLGGFIPVTLIGLWYAGRIGLSLRDLGKAGAGESDGPGRP